MRPYRIGITEDLYSGSGQPLHPSVDLARRLTRIGFELSTVPIPSARTIAPGALGSLNCLILGDCAIGASAIRSGMPTLQHIARFGIGYDDIDVAAATQCSVLVTNVRSGVQQSVAIGALTLLLALASGLTQKIEIVRTSAQWPHQIGALGTGLLGRNLGILGFGGIGQELARLARPFGLTVMASDPSWNSQLAQELGVERVSIEELFSQADFLSVNCPLSSTTTRLVSEKLLGRMKPTAYLINTARGAVVDEQALVRALSGGHIAGAALDVFETEPLSMSSELRQLQNVILTPHAIGMTDVAYSAYMDDVAAAVDEVARGGVPPSAVNTTGR